MKQTIEIDGVRYARVEQDNDEREFCIVRTYSAGVFAGWINREKPGMEHTIYNSRRIWYWAGAASLSQLANEGTKEPESCRFAQVVSETDVKQVIEIIPCTTQARENIQLVPVWQNE